MKDYFPGSEYTLKGMDPISRHEVESNMAMASDILSVIDIIRDRVSSIKNWFAQTRLVRSVLSGA